LDNTDVKLNKSILSLVEQYATAMQIGRVERRARHDSTSRNSAFRSVAYQRFVADQKKMSPGEFRDMQAGYQQDLQEAAEAEGVDIQGQFWPDLKKARREARRAQGCRRGRGEQGQCRRTRP
jgi:hypothetical protein